MQHIKVGVLIFAESHLMECKITSLVLIVSPDKYFGLLNKNSAPYFRAIFPITLLSVDTIILSNILESFAAFIE